MSADPNHYVRVTLSPDVRIRRERGHESPGMASVGGTLFFGGTAYVPRTATLARRLASGTWSGAEVTDADPEGLVDYLDAVDRHHNPPQRPPKPCHPARYIGTPRVEPAYCHGGHLFREGCRELYPQNFPPAPEPMQPGHL